MTYKLVYVRGKKRLEFSLSSGLVITSARGLTDQTVTIQAADAAWDVGAVVEKQRVDPKTLSFNGIIRGDSGKMRSAMLDTIVPMEPAQLIADDQWVLDVYPSATPDIERYTFNPGFSFTLYAPYPYWRAVEDTYSPMFGIQALFKFPWDFGKITRFSNKTITNTINVYNPGTVRTGWSATIYAREGIFKNPKLAHANTGEYIKINIDMAKGDKIALDYHQGILKCAYTPAGEETQDAFDKLDINSDPFQILPGDNLITLTGDEGLIIHISADITFQRCVPGLPNGA